MKAFYEQTYHTLYLRALDAKPQIGSSPPKPLNGDMFIICICIHVNSKWLNE